MSLNAYHQSLLAANVNIKTFVRECSSVLSKTKDKVEKRELNFHGDEAKVAYEQIVNHKNEDEGSSRCPNRRKKSSVSEKIKSETRCRDKDKNRDSRKHGVKVTANSILKAVEKGDIEYLEQNVNPSNVNVSDDYGWTPLMSAAFCGNYKIVDFLLKLGANTRCRDKSGFTAGGLASKKNYSGIVALLKEKQSTPDASSQQFFKSSNPRKDPELSQRRSRFYCSVCRETFRETTVEKHEASTLHIFNSKPKLPEAMYAIPRHNKGHEIMLKKGWKGEGLGPEGEGSKYPIKTVLKRDRRGLGQEKKESARVTHFRSGDARAITAVRREPREKIVRKRDREKLLSREARRDRAIRKELSLFTSRLQTMNDQLRMLKHLQQVEAKAAEILTDKQEVIALDKRRNDDRVGMRALQKQSGDKTWITVGPILLKMDAKKAEELLMEDQKECDIAVNKIRSELKVKVNELRDLEHNPPVPGLMLKPMSHAEMTAIHRLTGKSL